MVDMFRANMLIICSQKPRVDDFLIIGNDIGLIDELKKVLHQSFKMKCLGELKYFLGIEVPQLSMGIILNQRKFDNKMLVKPASTLLQQNKKFTTTEYDDFVHLGCCNDEFLLKIVVPNKYTTIYIICGSTHESIYAKPKKSLFKVAHQIVRYIKKNLSSLFPIVILIVLHILCLEDQSPGFVLSLGICLFARSQRSKAQSHVL
ncbi:protein detoxification 35 [Gossypium australe]|uniref:Protein detoxification 35 n=1 Tax=Gossypium australe TaxID=47621 RepID=A0A5B6WYN0_9ROSI|nr:protein detoxification 35 [Gossypium australe]